jgi:hypothetical protein
MGPANSINDMTISYYSCRWALKPAGRPLPHCRGGNGPPSATRRLRGGGAVVDTKNIVCHVNSSTCRVYVNSFYSTIYISFYEYAAAIVPTHFVHFLRFSTVCHSAFYRSYRSTAPPFFYICIFANIFVYLRLCTWYLQSQASTYVPFGLISTISEKIYSTYHTCFYIYACLCGLHFTSTAAHHLPCSQGGKECMATLHSSDRDSTLLYMLHQHFTNIFRMSHWFSRLRLPLWPSLYVYSGPSLALFSRC